MNGRTLLLADGYTFHKGGGMKCRGGIRWRCSSAKKKCSAYVVLTEDDQTVLKMHNKHNDHKRPRYKMTDSGMYTKV